MATAIARPVKRRADDIFFPAMSLLILAVVVFGFAQSYFFVGMVFAKLPSVVVHIHGALFISWILLLVIQNALVAAHRVKWHRTLGTFGVILPPCMIVFGVLTLVEFIHRHGPGKFARLVLLGDMEELTIFTALVAWGMLARRDAASHKRLMILGTMAMLGPAIDRWPFPRSIGVAGTIGVYIAIPLLVVAYDFWSRRRIHRTTAIAYPLIAIPMLTVIPLSNLEFFQRCVEWIERL